MIPGENPLHDLFRTVASAHSARIAAASAAGVQKAHYDQLVSEGMDPAVAIELTARTSIALFEGVSALIDAVGKNADKIAGALQVFMESTRPN